MKRNTMILIAVVMLLTGIGAAFASGNKDTAEVPYGRGPQWNIASNDKVTLTGTVTVSNKLHPELKVGSKLYYLMVPRYYLDDIEVKDGTSVTVEGFVATGVPMLNEKDEAVLVTKATIDGKEYDLERGYGHPMMGRGNFQGGGYGPRGYNRGGYRGNW